MELLSKNRKIILIAMLLTLALAAASCNKKPSAPVMHEGVGVVEGIDKEAVTVQINHEDIKGYMSAMSMPFKVKHPALLDTVKIGDKVDFTLEDSSAGIFVIDLKKKGNRGVGE
jgi:Cu(I)/Ag(I) efflux system periplasmic protein CusF